MMRILTIKRCLLCPFCHVTGHGYYCYNPKGTVRGAEFPQIPRDKLVTFPDFCVLEGE
jgi:hypothetical protein